MSLELWLPCAVRSCLFFVPVRGMVCQWHMDLRVVASGPVVVPNSTWVMANAKP